MFDAVHPSAIPALDALGGTGAPVVSVHPWSDPLLDRFGHDPRSPYVERFWLPIVGPSGTLLLRRLAEGFDTRPEGYALDLADVAQALGLVRRDGPSAGFRRALDRVISFGFAYFAPPAAIGADGAAAADSGAVALVVRRRLPGLTRRQLQRLPRALRDDHDSWLASQPPGEQAFTWNDDAA